ncbi:hypothetical protein [Acidicapsa acidisoli]|uniref:hypothetical protein n=1 Tax=Acidicapsa acidisoli TaxID=1615681 RepID=UPI0021DFD246|nr:hypothetical protein [Acidicapsa acidisoli]
MNLSRMLRFTLRVFIVLCGLVWNASLFAQNQPQATPCPLDGPSIADTLRYINDALGSQSFTDNGSGDQTDNGYSLTISGSQVTLSYLTTYGKSWKYRSDQSAPTQVSFASYNVDCHAVGERGINYVVNVPCTVAGDCVTANVQRDDGSWTTALTFHGFGMKFAVDEDKGQRLARAFSHLLALLQQQYKQSHSDPNDPFAKPQ